MNFRPATLLAVLLALLCFISPFRPLAAEYKFSSFDSFATTSL